MPSDLCRIDALRIYRIMRQIRRTEEELIARYHLGDEMRCPMHFCIGQESTPAALSLLVRKSDVMMSHYRSHGYYLGKGGSLTAMIAEFHGKATGSNSGLAGSMELGSHEYNFCSGAIVGGTLGIPLGTAFAQRYRGTDDISISVFGDGSFDEGVLYELMNLAALYRLPLLLICENNKYAAHTALSARLAFPALLPKVEAMGISGETVDGYDLVRLFEALRMAVDAIRAGSGPRFIEVMTYRFCGHVGPESEDYLHYRSAEEIADWQSRDPLARLRADLTADPATRSETTQIEGEIEAEIAAAMDAAKDAPFPSLDWACGTNWANSYAPIVDVYFREPRTAFQGGQAETKLKPF